MKQTILNKGWYLKQQESCERLSQEILDEAVAPDSDWLKVEAMPSMVHDVLKHHRVIQEPWKAGQAEACKWVAEKDWVYATRFDVDDTDGKTFLQFQGLDTIVDIYLNGELLASRSNMYLPLRQEVTGSLLPQNNLLLHFHSVFRNGEPTKISGDRLVRRPGNNYGSYLGPHPYFSRVGVFDDIFVQNVGQGAIYELVAGASLDENLKSGVVTVQVAGTSIDKAVIVVNLIDPNDHVVAIERIPIEAAGNYEVQATLEISQPSLWWPRGYGAQALYRVEARLVSDDHVYHEVHRSVGFRRVKMTEPLHFEINGKNVRLWGGDWVTPRWDTAVWDSDRVGRLLDIAENAHFNTFRIWGPVESPRDEFYELCDKRGFLLWQDFTDLPLGPDPAAREACREEALHLVKRLKNHPSVFFWCGCNEAAMWNDAEYFGPGGEWPGAVPFEEDVAPICRALDPDRPFLPSSPYHGVDNNDPQEWNTHGYTNLWFVPGYDFLNFASEDTRIAAPPLKSLKRFFDPEDLWPDGYTQSVTYGVQRPWPETWEKYAFTFSRDASEKKVGPVELFHDATNADELVYRLGAAEGLYYTDTIERQRRGRAADDDSNRRRCGGYIVWKYNDSWPEIYSAKVDYFLEPYMPYYAIRRAYAPILVSIDIGSYISVWVVNDSVEQVAGTLTVRLFHMDKNTVTKEVSCVATVAPDASTPVLRLDKVGIGSFRRENIIHAELADTDGRLIARASALVDFDRRLVFPDAELAVVVDESDLVITTDKFARSVFLEGNADGDEFGWLFEDNWFDLLPGETKRVRVLGRHNSGSITAGAWHSPHRTTVEWRRFHCRG